MFLSFSFARRGLLLGLQRDIKKSVRGPEKGAYACLLSRESQTSALCRIPFIADKANEDKLLAPLYAILVYRSDPVIALDNFLSRCDQSRQSRPAKGSIGPCRKTRVCSYTTALCEVEREKKSTFFQRYEKFFVVRQ